ncbi:MAG: DegT/DnrJ/EryC1/StrS family aminotransferase [Pyrinomonadaceae bacterium]|nr:DegT/DnrJ/EryC1/StrS family aminotransferase [Sphingobacteriaceae bacterium]
MKIPFSPPFIDQSVIDEVIDTLKSGWITSGPKVKALEDEVVKMTGTQAAVCVNSWTSGSILMLKWLGVKEGDEVIVPAYTYSATALSVLHCGATPIMVDIEDDFTISVEKIRNAITNKTKAIIAVDIAGWPCDYKSLNALVRDPDICKKFEPTSEKQQLLNRILLISDAAHSIGAVYNNKPAAQASDVTIFSFHAVKNITTAEGGCICLNLPESFDYQAEYRYLKMNTLNGQTKDALTKSKSEAGSWKYDILFPGLKINMPDVCAAIGLAQIRLYPTILHPQRKEVALKYCKAFSEYPWFIPPPLEDKMRESSYHLFALRLNGVTEDERDWIIDELMSKGIAINVHFIPMPMLTLFKNLGYKIEDYPNSYKQYACEISLPIYPQLENIQVNYIIDAVIETVSFQLMEKSDA